MGAALAHEGFEKFDIESLTLSVNEKLEEGADLAAVLTEILEWIEFKSDQEIISSVLLFNENTMQLFHGAAPSLPAEYNQAVNGIFAGPSNGSCGTAAFTKQQVIVSDIENDPLWLYYKSLALPLGLRACWSNPLIAEGKLLGTFAMYYKKTRKPDPEEIQLINSVSSLCICAIQSREADFLRMTLAPISKATGNKN